MFRRSGLAVVIGAALVLSGCGGSGSSTPENVSGVVADGYLENATVCLDINGNKACDAGEPTAVTDSTGAYTIETEGSTNYPIVAEIVAGLTVDQDNPGVVITDEYVLTSPAGRPEFVSPLSTMVQIQIENNPALSADEAENSVKASMGFAADSTVDLFNDYIEAEQAGDTTSEVLHAVAKVTVDVLQNNLDEVSAVAASTGMTEEAVLDYLVNAVVDQVVNELGTIYQAVETEIETGDGVVNTADIDTIVASSSLDDASLDTATLETEVEAQELASNLVQNSMLSILQAGVNWLYGGSHQECDQLGSCTMVNEYEYGQIGLGTDGSSLTETEYGYDDLSGVFVADSRSHMEVVLGANGWVLASDGASNETITFNSDNTATLTWSDANGGTLGSEVVSGSGMDVSGQPVGAFLADEQTAAFAAGLPTDLLFPANSMAYRWSFSSSSDSYDLWVWIDDDETNSCWDGTPASTYGNNCNVVRASSQIGPDTLVTTLAGMVGAEVWVGNDLSAQLAADGTVTFSSYSSSAAPGTAPEALTVSSTWSQITVNTEEMIKFEIPADLRDLIQSDGDVYMIFSVHDGFVRMGSFTPGGSIDNDDGWTFNDTAMQAILDNFTAP